MRHASLPVRRELASVSLAAVDALSAELGVSRVLAQVLARRGYCAPDDARRFLDAAERHPPEAFAGIAGAVELVLAHVRRGSQITVHGDYDCDGVCSTAVLIEVLRELGANVDWFLPDRLADGYGLAAATVARLLERGTALLITADCAVTAVEEVAAARAGGLDVLVTDHHAPREDGRLPEAPLVHPALCGYPCPDLCATAVAAKLAQALRAAAGLDSRERDSDLELVALATVADVVALRGENRRLVRAGLRALSRTARPGLRALMHVAGVDPLRIDERALAFRLAPRVNAAGRLYRPDSALELLLSGDEQRASSLADELDHANAERRAVEQRIRFEAEAQVQEAGPSAAYVLAATGWHAGVIGIVAARIAEQHNRPAVLISLPAESDGDPAVGSGRSIAGFDLLEGLRAGAEHLLRFGGHRAAAGLQIDSERVADFRQSFVSHAQEILGAGEPWVAERVDAIASGQDIGLELAEELARLAPYGSANPPVSLLLPAARLSDASTFGRDGSSKHLRFTVHSGGAQANAVAFGAGPRLPVEPDEAVDATFALERDDWRGVVSPRLLLRSVTRCEPEPVRILGEDGAYSARALAELDRPLALASAAPAGAARRERCDRRGRGVAATIAELLASGEPILVVCADATARARHLERRLGGFALCTHAALERAPELATRFRHLVVLDPPGDERAAARIGAGEPAQQTHLAWGEPELRFAMHIHQQEFGLRDSLVACYRALRASGGAAGEELEAVLRGLSTRPRSPEHGGRVLRVLAELDLLELDRERWSASTTAARRRSQLERSAAYRSYRQTELDGLQYLRSKTEKAA